jgi:hypothetical protein
VITRQEVETPISGEWTITGGTIDGTTIGSTVPAAGSFTSLGVSGNITVGGTVDGVDVAVLKSAYDTHVGLANAHHEPVTAGNTAISLTGQQVILALATTSGLTISSGLMLADSVAGDGLTISSKVLAVGQGDGLTVSADAVALTTPGTLSHATSNSAVGNHTHASGRHRAKPPPGAASLLKRCLGLPTVARIGLKHGPSYPLHVSGATQQARNRLQRENYLAVSVGSDGSTLLSTGNQRLRRQPDVAAAAMSSSTR